MAKSDVSPDQRPEDGFAPHIALEEMRASQKGMQDTINAIMGCRVAYGSAKAIIEFSEPQQKHALAEATARVTKAALEGGEELSFSRAESLARIEPGYEAEMKRLLNSYADAHAQVQHVLGLKAAFEMHRSVLSFEKTLLAL